MFCWRRSPFRGAEGFQQHQHELKRMHPTQLVLRIARRSCYHHGPHDNGWLMLRRRSVYLFTVPPKPQHYPLRHYFVPCSQPFFSQRHGYSPMTKCCLSSSTSDDVHHRLDATNEDLLLLPLLSDDQMTTSNPSQATGTTTSSTETFDMTNLYQQWTLEQDQILWQGYQNDQKSAVELAVELGRGLGGVQARLSKLRDVNSPAYERLFVQSEDNNDNKMMSSTTKQHKRGSNGKNNNQRQRQRGGNKKNNNNNNSSDNKKEGEKLVPVSQVLQRIQWDSELNSSDFHVVYVDRVNETLVECSLEAVNDHVKGPEIRFVDALPKHRIVVVKYRERIIWDRRKRLDLMFSSGSGSSAGTNSRRSRSDEGTTTTTTTTTSSSSSSNNNNNPDGGETSRRGIEHFIATYDEWKQQRDIEIERLVQRRSQISNQMRQVLGLERNTQLETLVQDFQTTSVIVRGGGGGQSNYKDLFLPSGTTFASGGGDIGNSAIPLVSKLQVEKFVEQAREILLQPRNDPSQSLDPSLIPMSDYDALDLFSEWIVLLPLLQDDVKPTVLAEISEVMKECSSTSGGYGNRKSQSQPLPKNRPLPTVDEADLTETFIRGSGPGGQKINKTSNRVVLVHNPTQLRVECQETRSLPQNRKLARRRMQEKLDEYLFGSRYSKQGQAEQKASQRKAKAKARSRARHKRKRLEQQQKESSNSTHGEDNDNLVTRN